MPLQQGFFKSGGSCFLEAGSGRGFLDTHIPTQHNCDAVKEVEANCNWSTEVSIFIT